MPDLKTTIRLSLVGGPEWNIEHRQDVDAYDVVELILDAGTTDRVVELQPAAGARINLFAIQSSLYGSQITFKASDGGTDSGAIALLGPQLYANGAAALFSVAPRSIKLSNAHPAGDATKRARVQILIGRDATP
jgi:hypothetical protein